MSDGTDALCMALYGREPKMADMLGGSKAKMLYDAAERISAQSSEGAVMREALEKLGRLPCGELDTLAGCLAAVHIIALSALAPVSEGLKQND